MNKNNKRNIVFIFSGGRLDRLNNTEDYAKDFFYGFFGIKENFLSSKVIEIEHQKTPLVNFIDKIVSKLLKLPLAFSSIFNKKLKKETEKADIVVLVNESVMFYSLLYLYFFKKRNKNLKIVLFTMGLFSNINKKSKRRIFQKFIIKNLCIKIIDKFVFLGKGEYLFACKEFERYQMKFNFIPFGIDTNFWQNNKEYDLDNRTHVLFIGNDLNRDYKFLTELVKELNDINFIILTSQIKKNEINFENVTLIDGMWWENRVSDKEIKELYSRSILTILPLKDTLQPSGQSVALQSMISRTPVMITETKGFWDRDNFINNKDIFFVSKNEINLWKDNIHKLMKDPNSLKRVSNKSFELVNYSYNLKNFTDSFSEILNLD